tara:strand:+ start:1623 stop:2633 length:1011 start_codon:yes stop_codon:yes gene_type:complete
MQKRKEKMRYVGQCVTYKNVLKNPKRVKRRKTYKGSERNLTFYPVISVLDKFRIDKIENLLLSLLSVLHKYTDIDLKCISNFNQEQLINFLNSNLNDLLKSEKEYFNYDNITFDGKSIILYHEEPEVGNCFTFDCIDNVEDENLKKIIRYVIGSLVIKYDYPTINTNVTFRMTLEYCLSDENEDLDLEINESDYIAEYDKKLQQCINEFVKGNNDWHYDYIMENPNHCPQAKIMLKMINHYNSYSCNDFKFSDLVTKIEDIENEEIIPFQNYMCLLPKDDEIFKEYEHHLNDYWNNYEFERLIYKKEYSLDGIVNTTKQFKTVQYIKKLIDYLWQI